MSAGDTAFTYRHNTLFAEDVALHDIARQHGTPCYVYSKTALTSAYRGFAAAFAPHAHLICYAVKANPNLAILNLFAKLGSGFDIVSGGEMARVIAAGGDPGKIVFSGVGKTETEIRDALNAGILCFNVESPSELERINRIAGELNKVAPVSLRVNPDVDAKTHPYIATGLKENKFGVAYGDALALYRRARDLKNLKIDGIDCHIGSQLTEVAPFSAAVERVLALVHALNSDGIELAHIDLGGGLGIQYEPEEAPCSIEEYAAAILKGVAGRKETLMFEPGRYLVGDAGVLLTRVEYLKRGEDRNFAIVDAAMNDLMRPALYQAWHDIVPVDSRPNALEAWEIVGPVCESGDFLGRGRKLALKEGDLLAIRSAGAYGMSMSSNYNTRARAAEVMVDGANAHLIRKRETLSALYANEIVPK
ncbi:MAG: diaminopimelate decarboxylase [Betaproteobacteria bacterium]|nr:diaminopimelate decarboxylase [Betaproteobacteria bacterium]